MKIVAALAIVSTAAAAQSVPAIPFESVPNPLQLPAEEIVASLEKVYAAKNILCEFEIDPQARFYGEEGDLLELLGNLLENAFKWARGRVLFSARVPPARGLLHRSPPRCAGH